MATLATVFYVLAGIMGLIMLATHGSPALLLSASSASSSASVTRRRR